MRLKSLEMHGFKSFADKTKLEFHEGVTGIVGPNGCGKSNIVDGMRWVLGETSAKALRGGEMADVIFNGTDRRQPLGMAEVTLTLSGCEGILDTEYDEVAIGRRSTAMEKANISSISSPAASRTFTIYLWILASVGRATPLWSRERSTCFYPRNPKIVVPYSKKLLESRNTSRRRKRQSASSTTRKPILSASATSLLRNERQIRSLSPPGLEGKALPVSF